MTWGPFFIWSPLTGWARDYRKGRHFCHVHWVQWVPLVTMVIDVPARFLTQGAGAGGGRRFIIAESYGSSLCSGETEAQSGQESEVSLRERRGEGRGGRGGSVFCVPGPSCSLRHTPAPTCPHCACPGANFPSWPTWAAKIEEGGQKSEWGREKNSAFLRAGMVE